MKVNILTIGQIVVILTGKYQGKRGTIISKQTLIDWTGVKYQNVVRIAGERKRTFSDDYLKVVA